MANAFYHVKDGVNYVRATKSELKSGVYMEWDHKKHRLAHIKIRPWLQAVDPREEWLAGINAQELEVRAVTPEGFKCTRVHYTFTKRVKCSQDCVYRSRGRHCCHCGRGPVKDS